GRVPPLCRRVLAPRPALQRLLRLPARRGARLVLPLRLGPAARRAGRAAPRRARRRAGDRVPAAPARASVLRGGGLLSPPSPVVRAEALLRHAPARSGGDPRRPPRRAGGRAPDRARLGAHPRRPRASGRQRPLATRRAGLSG